MPRPTTHDHLINYLNVILTVGFLFFSLNALINSTAMQHLKLMYKYKSTALTIMQCIKMFKYVYIGKRQGTPTLHKLSIRGEKHTQHNIMQLKSKAADLLLFFIQHLDLHIKQQSCKKCSYFAVNCWFKCSLLQKSNSFTFW